MVGSPPVAASARRSIEALRGLTINQLRRVLLAGAPPFAVLRFERIAIRPGARATRLSTLPMPRPLRKAVSESGRTRLGDLHGLTYLDVSGHGWGRTQAMRQLHGLLRIARATPSSRRPGPLFVVPARARPLPCEDVPMPTALRAALRDRGVRTLGQIARLTPARLGKNFGTARWRELEELLGRLAMLPPPGAANRPTFAPAVDEAMSRLPASRRRALDLRFGARGRPVLIRDVAARCGLDDLVDPHRKLDRWTRALGRDAGTAVLQALRTVRSLARAGGPRPTSNQVDAALGISRGPHARARDFYLRLLRRIDPSVKFDVVWGKKVPRRRR